MKNIHGQRIVAAFTTTAIILTSACADHTQTAPRAPFVSTSVATTGVIHPSERLAGIIAPFENVAIQTTLSEPADTVDVQEGQVVRRGQQLAQLDTADLQAQLEADLATANGNQANTSHTTYQGSLNIAQGVDTYRAALAGVQQAQANLERDERDLARDRSLLAEGYISQQQVQAQEATVRDDQANLQSVQSTLATARSTVQVNGTLGSSGLQSSSVQQSAAQEQVALAQARQVRVQISKATIVSPVDGVVVNRNLNPGEYPGNRQIFTVQQVDPIFAILRGSGSQVAQIASGTNAGIEVADLGDPPTFNGKVVGVLNQIVPGSTDFEVKVLLQNRGQKLRPGMAVQGRVALPAIRGIRIPLTAFTDDNHDTVDIVTTEDKVKTVHVTEIGNDGASSIVSGIASGTRVVSDGQTSVGDGEKVSIK